MKKTSIKAAVLFSTLIFGTVEASTIVNQNSNYTIIAHADTSTSNISTFDPEIQKILLNSVNQSENKNYTNADEITNDDLASLNTINYSGSESESIKTLNNFNSSILPNLSSITINNVDMGSITDFSPITSLNKLNTIQLNGTNINSNQLATLGQWNNPSLTSLDLSNNQISNLDFLKNITIPNITSININNNEVSDFSPVKNQQWKSLTSLHADNNNISDISPISQVNWSNLQTLSVKHNKISNISPISSASWPNLIELYADNNNISDINSFANTNWHKLQTISATGNHISNVSSLKNKSNQFPNLTNFYVSNNNINDISWMNGYQFSTSSEAKQEVVNATANVIKNTNGKTVYIPLPITINDVSLDGTFKASADTNGKNIIVDNKYLNQDGEQYNQNGTLVDPSALIGNDNKQYATTNDSNGNTYSNGVAGVNIASGFGSQKYTFGFSSTLGINQTGYFYGAYNLTVNWGENTSENKTVNVTVKYIGDDGNELGEQTKSIKFTETGFKPDDNSQPITWNNDWTTSDDTSYSFTSPEFVGYKDPSKTTVIGKLDANSKGFIETVTYKKDDKSTVASPSTNHSNNTNNSNKEVTVERKTSTVNPYKNNAGNPNKTVTIKHVDPAVPGNKKNASHHDAENKNKLPQTGDETNQNVLIALGSAAIVTAIGLAVFALRRKNK